MSERTGIAWTDATWNPVRGCSLVSRGCTNCYAMRQAHRFSGAGKPYEGLTKTTSYGPTWTGEVRTVPELLDVPLHWRKPRRVFVNSMSDLFHDDVPDYFIEDVFVRMALAHWHTFQVLTKRPRRALNWTSEGGRFADLLDKLRGSELEYWLGETAPGKLSWPLPNVWLGVSVEDQKTADERIPKLLATPAAVRFLSCEPLLEEITIFGLNGQIDVIGGTKSPLDWVICGGESGPKARPFDIQWGRYLSQQCAMAGAAFFMKQAGSRVRVSRHDCLPFAMRGSWTADGPGAPYGTARPFDRAGADPLEWPEDLCIRQFPAAA